MEQGKINTLSDYYQQQDDQLDDNNDNDLDEADGRIKNRILSLIANRAGWSTTSLSKEGK